MNATNPCIRTRLFAAVWTAVQNEAVDLAALVEQTGHTEARVREVVATLSVLADGEAAASVTGVSLAQALTARRQGIEVPS